MSKTAHAFNKIMKDADNKVIRLNGDAFADAAMCIAAGSVMADGIISPKEMATVREIIRDHEKLAHLDPETLLQRFDKFLLVYQMEEKFGKTKPREEMEKLVFSRLTDDGEKRMAAALAWKIIVKDDVVECERRFIDRIYGPGGLHLKKR